MTLLQIYKNGAHKGVSMGIYLTVTSILLLTSHHGSLIAMFALLFVFGVPFVQYRLMLDVYRKNGCQESFSGMWMLGITIFIGASLICAAVTYGYLTVFDPGYFYDRGQEALELFSRQPEFATLRKQMKIALDEGLYPTPIGYCMEMIMITVFFGSLLSIVLSPLVRLNKAKHSRL